MMNPDQEMESPEELGEDLIGTGAGLSEVMRISGGEPGAGCDIGCPMI
jgi:hypothetical protein